MPFRHQSIIFDVAVKNWVVEKHCFFEIFKIDDTSNEILLLLIGQGELPIRVLSNFGKFCKLRGGVLERVVAETTVNVTFGVFFSGALFARLTRVSKTLCFCLVSATLCAKP